MKPARRILVIDDNPEIHRDFRKVLAPEDDAGALAAAEAVLFGDAPAAPAQTGFAIDCASQGAEGLALAERAAAEGSPYAVAFVDMRMPPGWDGLETIARLWRADAQLQCVICTAYSDHSWREVTARLGRSDRLLILKKPFERIEILQTADALAAKWQHARAAERALRLEAELARAQRFEALGRMAGGVAHDFNNLLAGILGFAELAARQLGDHPAARPLAQARRAGEQAAALTRQLLAFSRRQPVAPQRIDLARQVQETLPLLRRLAGDGVRIDVAHDAASCPVLIDPAQFQQVLLNLVVNARDAMADGGVCTIAVRRDGAGAITVVVEDTGTGIAPELCERIFEPFFSTKAVGHGTGLGLATVHGIVHQAGGGIAVEGRPGLGARFTITLPEHRGETPPPVPSPPPEPPGAGRVLVVDDVEPVRVLVAEVLRQAGYEVEEYGDPQTALAQGGDPARGRIDLLVTDVVMPGLDGPTLAERLRVLQPDLRVLFITGWPDRTSGLPGPVLGKPFPHDELLRAVRRALVR